MAAMLDALLSLAPAFQHLTVTFPCWRASGPEHHDPAGQLWQEFEDYACGWHGVLVEREGGQQEVFWAGGVVKEVS